MLNSVIYIAGTDGSGKTTILKDIEEKIKYRNVKRIWIRSPKILSKPLMAYCRVAGLTKYKTIDGVEYGKHEFYRSKFVSWLYPLLQLIDFKIKWYFEKKKIKSDYILLFDRFSLDTLVDIMVDTKRINLHNTWIGKEFFRMIPVNSKTILLEVDEKIIRKRKLDTLHDEYLKDKIEIFNMLSVDFNLKMIDNNREYKIVVSEILKYIFDGKF